MNAKLTPLHYNIHTNFTFSFVFFSDCLSKTSIILVKTQINSMFKGIDINISGYEFVLLS